MANKQFFLDRETDPLNPALEVANKDELIKVYTDAGDLITDLSNLDDNEIAACEGNDFQNVYISNTITAGDMNVPTVDAVKTYVDSNIPSTKVYGPFTLGSADFTSDNTYSGYPYKVTITCVGVDDSYSAAVNFRTSDAHLGIFSPFAETGSDAVSFYASSIPAANVVVNNIICTEITDGVNEGGSTNAYKGTKYSTSETFTGNYWIDGKPIYKKVYDITLTGETTLVAHGLTNIDRWLKPDGFTKSSSDLIREDTRPMPFAYFNTNNWSAGITVDNTNIIIQVGSDFLARHSACYIILEYTKN